MRIACKGALLFLLFVTVISCGPDPTVQMKKEDGQKVSQYDDHRFQVSRVGIFEDDLAYSSRRGIYILYDSESGKQFVGISGVGIVELGNHSAGKTVQMDER